MLNGEECVVFGVTQTENRRLTITMFELGWGTALGGIYMLNLNIGKAASET
jgi:patatin-like phospholipase/acyl hydrolase